MKRATKSIKTLHKFNNENKGDSFDGLIYAAEQEIHRLDKRRDSLTHAIEVFKRKKNNQEPLARVVTPLHPTQSDHQTETAAT